ncbi:MAG: hypothetical protein EBZ49_07425 [Proteobacteria bacterium]|nr:hypothetical protein [Pseudomonadota bacterium]
MLPLIVLTFSSAFLFCGTALAESPSRQTFFYHGKRQEPNGTITIRLDYQPDPASDFANGVLKNPPSSPEDVGKVQSNFKLMREEDQKKILKKISDAADKEGDEEKSVALADLAAQLESGEKYEKMDEKDLESAKETLVRQVEESTPPDKVDQAKVRLLGELIARKKTGGASTEPQTVAGKTIFPNGLDKAGVPLYRLSDGRTLYASGDGKGSLLSGVVSVTAPGETISKLVPASSLGLSVDGSGAIKQGSGVSTVSTPLTGAPAGLNLKPVGIIETSSGHTLKYKFDDGREAYQSGGNWMVNAKAGESTFTPNGSAKAEDARAAAIVSTPAPSSSGSGGSPSTRNSAPTAQNAVSRLVDEFIRSPYTNGGNAIDPTILNAIRNLSPSQAEELYHWAVAKKDAGNRPLNCVGCALGVYFHEWKVLFESK